MIEKSKNPISIRSRKMITNALMELLKEKPYEEITVTDIAERSQLVRKTFYRNFTGKDEIIECYFQDICKKFICEFKNNQVCNYYEYALIVFRFWKPYGKMLIFLNKKNLFDYFQKAFDQIAPLASDFSPVMILRRQDLNTIVISMYAADFVKSCVNGFYTELQKHRKPWLSISIVFEAVFSDHLGTAF